MADREEIVVEDVDEWQDRRDHRANVSTRIGRIELPIYNGREDPTRFLARYTLARKANNKGAQDDLVRKFPSALIGIAVEWFINMDVSERLT